MGQKNRSPVFSSRAMFHALSPILLRGLCFFRLLNSVPPSACLTVLPAIPCAWRSDGFFTFHIIDHNGQLRRSLNAGSSTIPYGYVSDPHPACICIRWDAHYRPYNLGRSVAFVDDASAALCIFSPYCPDLSPYSRKIRDRVSASQLPPLSVHCREGFTPRHSAQRQHASLRY